MRSSRTEKKVPTSAKDVDLLLLIREEEVYAGRIRDALIFTETKLQRIPAPVVEIDQAKREARRVQYIRPLSPAEKEEIMSSEDELPMVQKRKCKKEPKIIGLGIDSPVPYVNPNDLRRTVDDEDALFSKSSVAKGRVEFTYDDLVATKEGRKVTTVKALKRLANLWDKNAKLNKEQMLTELISEYARRYPDEVEAYEQRKSSRRKIKRFRRQPRRRF